MRRSFRALKKDEPYGRLIIKMFKNLIQLMNRPGRKFLYDIDNMITAALNMESSDEGDTVIGQLLTKHEYIAIVGTLKATEAACEKAANELGFNKSDIRFFTDVNSYKNGGYTEKLTSARCVAVIIGGVPHSSHENVEEQIKDKIYYARTGDQGNIRLTLHNIKQCLVKIKKNLSVVTTTVG